jgi:hypothetical protein
VGLKDFFAALKNAPLDAKITASVKGGILCPKGNAEAVANGIQ